MNKQYIKFGIIVSLVSVLIATILFTFVQFGLSGGVDRHPTEVCWTLASLIVFELFMLSKRYVEDDEFFNAELKEKIFTISLSIMWPLGVICLIIVLLIYSDDMLCIKHIRKKTRPFRYFIKNVFSEFGRGVTTLGNELIKPR